MDIRAQIGRIANAVESAHQKVAEMGGTTAQPYLAEKLEEAISTIPVGEEVTAETDAYTGLLYQLETVVNAMPE